MRTVVKVPGRFRDDYAYLDLETRKVLTDPLFIMANGEALSKRWQVLMAGVARYGEIHIVEYDGGEPERAFLSAVSDAIGPAEAVVYGATRQFDEMILKGRFTNARRAHSEIQFFPALPGAEYLAWANIGAGHPHSRSETDLASWRVSRTYDEGGEAGKYRVRVHNLRDVAELILQEGDPDEECANWCLDLLRSDEVARKVLVGSSHLPLS